jgi:hypothetical protein
MPLRPGDILIFKRNTKDWVSRVLSWILQRFESDWDRWGWHTGYISSVLSDGTIITAEATGNGVQAITYPTFESLGEIRAYRWLSEPNIQKLEAFTQDHLGRDYDVACYFWTSAQYLILHLFNHPIPRILNDRYTCWELVAAMARAMGKPLQPIHQYPLITDMVKALENEIIM